MKLQVLRFSSESDSTSGLLFDITNGIKFLCYTLEDEHREEKVMGETRIPGFEWILIHCGNTDDSTGGCLLLGDSQENNAIRKDGYIGHSTQAYKRIYPSIARALEKGDNVTITYIDLDAI